MLPLNNPVGEDIKADGTVGMKSTEKTVLSQWLKANTLGASWCGNTNMVPEFCRTYIKEKGTQVTAVHCAKGSTDISYWIPGTTGYKLLKNKSLAAIKKVSSEHEINHIYFVWLQGESDAILGVSKDKYKEKLLILSNALKHEIGVEIFGIIKVGRFTNDERDIAIMDAQTEICDENSDFLMLTQFASELCSKPEYMNPFVGGHYNAKGQELIGRLAGTTLGKLSGNC